jgi:hypothetical protein
MDIAAVVTGLAGGTLTTIIRILGVGVGVLRSRQPARVRLNFFSAICAKYILPNLGLTDVCLGGISPLIPKGWPSGADVVVVRVATRTPGVVMG